MVRSATAVLGSPALGLPLPIWGALLSNLFMLVGWHWDISWHRSIGRDDVWTLPHLSIYLALALAFLYNSALVLSQTFGARRTLPGIRVLGFTGPSGAFVTLWGILLQFTAILFDNWWHNVYGLDVAVFSPPHAVLGTGIAFFYIGQFMLAVLFRNASPPGDRVSLWVAVILWSVVLGQISISVDPSYGYQSVRNQAFVTSSAFIYPLALVAIHAYLKWRWAATASSAVYMLTIILLMQIFQFFPAKPLFGPVFHRTDVFLPPLFPLLLVVPAFALDTVLFLWKSPKRLSTWIVLGVAFVVFFNAANWLVSYFLETPWAANRLFAAHLPLTAFEKSPRVAPQVGIDAVTGVTLLVAATLATFSAWLAFRGGEWMKRVVR